MAKQALVLMAMLGFSTSMAAHAGSRLSTLYTFTGLSDGAYPGPLVYDGSGNFYGATANAGSAACISGCGTIFELSPPAAGQTSWTETTLYSFTGQADGAYPGGVIRDQSGALFGVAFEGGDLESQSCSGGCGTVFELTPPAAGHTSWAETTLHEFDGVADGSLPEESKLAMDDRGDLFGTTLTGPGSCQCGTVFELRPPQSGQTTWTTRVLYKFKGRSDGYFPESNLTIDRSGNLFGTTIYGGTANDGTVFELSPPPAGSTSWTESILYRFLGGADGQNPSFFGVITDGSSTLYGITGQPPGGGQPGHGTVYSLTPPLDGQTAWTHSVLYSFAGKPDGSIPESVVFDMHGDIDGVTAEGGRKNAGTVFRLAPPQAGGTSWSETLLYSFNGSSDGNYPSSVVLRKGKLYGVSDGYNTSYGTIFATKP